MFCPKCGTQLDENVRFCAGCGHRFENAPAQVQPPSAPIQQQTPPQPAPVIQQAPTQNAPKNEKGANPIVVFFITFLVLGAIVAAIMLFVYPGLLMGGSDDDDDSSSKKAKDSSSVSQIDSSEADSSEADSSKEETTTTTAATTTTTSAAPPTTSAPETPPTDTTTTAMTLTPPDTQATTTTAAPVSTDLDEAEKFSTDQRATFEEFDWCYSQSSLVREAPADAKLLTTAQSITGGWKCMIVYSEKKDSEVLAREINNMYIGAADNIIAVVIDWHLMEIPGSESINEDDMDDSTLTADYKSGGFKGSSDEMTLELTKFWQKDGKQYAIGELTTEGDFYGYVALVRK